ncbi:hypothetical protein H5410_008588 [Solanum commersonii]|uniref:Uncharacterized protein n=1 Tax=Solanum commersonii TaxID=4109 RepID=A0A9J6AH21_SOLCO|nr:hypothetical protein H5410_008588 [Solanum commersonii]
MAIGSVVGFVCLELATSFLHSGYSLQPLDIVSVHEEHINIHVAILFRINWIKLGVENKSLRGKNVWPRKIRH